MNSSTDCFDDTGRQRFDDADVGFMNELLDLRSGIADSGDTLAAPGTAKEPGAPLNGLESMCALRATTAVFGSSVSAR